MSTSIALQRLAEERKTFRKARPFGFSAKPVTKPDGSVDLTVWKCIIPGKEKTLCEGAKFPCTIRFGPNYPAKPPAVHMPKGFFHVNICPETGGVCLSMLKEEVPKHLGAVPGWAPSVTITQLLLALQELLHTPNFGSVLGVKAYEVKARLGQKEYDAKTRAQALKYAEAEDED